MNTATKSTVKPIDDIQEKIDSIKYASESAETLVRTLKQFQLDKDYNEISKELKNDSNTVGFLHAIETLLENICASAYYLEELHQENAKR
jgi:hypothetical protein